LLSIDYPIDTLAIVNNGADPGVHGLLEQILLERATERQSGLIQKMVIYTPSRPLGVAESWNLIMTANPKAEYWEFSGSDIRFSIGDLAKIDQYVRDHLHYVTMPANWGHSLFAVTAEGRDRIGEFDENFVPAYSEDQDHMYRVKLAGAEWADVPGIRAIHGEPPLWGSSTVWSDPVLLEQCKVAQPNNLEYYARKWGGRPGKETYVTPYNNPNLTLKDWQVDRALRIANGQAPGRLLITESWG